MDETGLPDHIVDAVTAFARTLAPFIPERHLRLGGGTVLQARWRHRRSTDADLFCDPQTYAEAVRTHGREMERALSDVSNTLTGEDTFVDQIATYTESAAWKPRSSQPSPWLTVARQGSSPALASKP